MSATIRRRKKSSHNSPHRVLMWQIIIGLVCFSLLGLIGYGVWYVSHLESLNIKQVEVQGGKTISHELVKRTALSTLEGSYYKLVPKSFIWTYPKQDLEENIKNIERLEKVFIEELDGNTLSIKITEYVPKALWCEVDFSRCLFLAENGHAFAEAPNLTGGSFLRYQTTEQELQVGESIADLEVMFNTIELAESLSIDFDWPVSYVELSGRGNVNFFLKNQGVLKTSSRQTNVEILDNLTTILISDEFKHLTTSDFQYIDLRFGDKVFIKEEPDEEIDEPEATSTPETTEE